MKESSIDQNHYISDAGMQHTAFGVQQTPNMVDACREELKECYMTVYQLPTVLSVLLSLCLSSVNPLLCVGCRAAIPLGMMWEQTHNSPKVLCQTTMVHAVHGVPTRCDRFVSKANIMFYIQRDMSLLRKLNNRFSYRPLHLPSLLPPPPLLPPLPLTLFRMPQEVKTT